MSRTITIGITLGFLCLLFLFNGIFATVNDVLKPLLREDIFKLTYGEAALTHFSFFLTALFVPIPANRMVGRVGIRKTLITGLCIMLGGSLMIVGAGYLGRFSVFVLGIFITAIGTSTAGSVINPYILNVSSTQEVTARLNLVNSFYMLGGILGPIWGSQLLQKRLAQADPPPSVVQLPYLGLSLNIFLVILALLYVRMPEPNLSPDNKVVPGSKDPHPFQYPYFLLGWLALFLYAGAEIATGSMMVDYLGLTQTTNLGKAAAGMWVSVYWGGYMVGRLLGGTVLSHVSPERLLRIGILTSLGLLTVVMLGRGWWAGGALIALGLAQSIIFPSLFQLSTRGLGNQTLEGSAIFLTGIVGGGILALVQGMLADLPRIGVQLSFLLTFFGNLYILFYAYKGCRLRKKLAS